MSKTLKLSGNSVVIPIEKETGEALPPDITDWQLTTNENRLRQTYFVLVLGYWGKGATLKEAAENCRKQGVGLKERTVCKMIVHTGEHDETDFYVDRSGSINYFGACVPIGNGMPLGALLKVEE
jgi:hypothetical protein